MLAAVLMWSCGDDDNDDVPVTPTTSNITLTFIMPSGVEEGTLSGLSVLVKEVNTGKETTFTPMQQGNTYTVSLSTGYYNITVNGNLTFTKNGNEKHVTVQAYKEGVTVNGTNQSLSLNLYMTSEPEADPEPDDPYADPEYAYKGFVLAEIFPSGSATPQGTYYYADKYLIIYNNTDHVLYADSLAFAESEFLTVMKQEYHPDIMSEAMAVKALYMIPGNGREHPVEPGGSLILVDNALDHRNANPNSWDMTLADFEWYDESTDPDYSDVDNPQVVNLVRIYSSTLTMYSPHTQGFTAFALVRMQTDRIDFLTNYRYDFSYHLVGQAGEADMTGISYRVPNEWIIDAVNLSTQIGMQWLVVDPSLDRGFAYVSMFPFDDSRLGLSVRRKVASYDGSRAILQDTNNSTDDFDSRVAADPFFFQ